MSYERLNCRERTAYKLLRRRKDGTLGPLFINRKQVIPLGVWLEAEDHQTKRFSHRPGWHCLAVPFAPHLSEKNRVWCRVTIRNWVEERRPMAQGGRWFLAQSMRVDEIAHEKEE